MKPNIRLFPCVIALGAMGGAVAHAQTTTIHSKLIVIQGDDNFNATSINVDGAIVGTLYAGITDAPSGLEINGKTITTLASPGDPWGALNPRVITDKGDILGWARNTGSLSSTDMFLLQGTSFNQAYQATLIEPGSNIAKDQPLQMQLTKDLRVSFNTLVSLSGPVGTTYGKPPNFRHVPAMNRFTHVNSVNDIGMVAGNSYSFSGISSVYLGSKGVFTTIAPPNTRNTSGGYLNNKGQLAGSFEDTSGTYHGFVYQGGNFTVFDMPEAASSVTVNAINDKGRVVGSFTGPQGAQRGFIYNGTTVTSFGKFDGSDNLTLAIGNAGGIVLSQQIPASEPKYLSYRVICSGTSC